jgi:integrating conjugative element protein (TIGR03755 family)
VFCVCGAVIEIALAETPAPTEDGLWYYEIGGADPVSLPASPRTERVTLGGSVELGLGYSCAAFDPVVAVSNSLNDISAGVDNMMDAMTDAASSAIAALPALILQRANPGLYDLFQNALLKAEESMQIATKSCETMEAEIAQGKNPYADLITLSKGTEWKRQMGIGGNDAVTAKEAVESSNGDNGIPWMGGSAGGAGQPPLRLTGDIVEAGYRVNLNQAAGPANPPAAIPEARLQQLWDTPEDARNWVTDVVGEAIISTCDGCAKDSVPGTGLLPKKLAEQQIVTMDLTDLVSGASAPNREVLEDVTAPGVAITRQVIEAIQEMPPAEQGLITGRLVAEIATARTLERALMARRLILSGRQVPEVYAANVAREHADTAITELDREIDNLLFETRVRREVVSDTVVTLLQRAAARRQASMSVPSVPVIDPKPLKDGRVEQ